MIMATFEGISQVHVDVIDGRRTNKVVKKWSEQQTDLFAAVLSLRSSKDGEQSSWAEELENLAVKKSSNEKLFREIQTSLEEELVKIDQSFRDNDEEATFSVPQLRAKYKWLKREWKIIQSKLNYGLQAEEMKIPGWYKLLDPVFSVYQNVNKDEPRQRPSMVIENGSLQNGESHVDKDSHAATKKRNIVSALNRPESFETERVETAQPRINKPPNDILSSEIPRVDPIVIVRVPNNNTATSRDGQTFQRLTRARSEDSTSESPPRKAMRLDGSNERINEVGPSLSPGINPISRVCKSESDRYVEIIKHLLDAEERRERMFVGFQKEQAEANRQHEIKMAQFFAQCLSQQQVLSQGINQILHSLSKNTDKK
ncbi:uncharacterized protein LOC116308376 [Actinia tenebrosa]|uniref:Uncharacterized protein LOC116308376 n=1 Tax=Actinia tenebrosa TaxID=6105 RepID=A0A6P8J4N4_ACTTE|nr:uncharacterized protein LOC116308376 [Actinia tenebrosa]